jgi:uncharacterized protein (DUF2147 family)
MTGIKALVALRGVLLIAGFECVYCALALADPIGLWLAKDGAHVSITACSDALCAVLVSTKSPNDPATGAPWTDKHNSNPALRSRPLVGVAVLMGMQSNGSGKWSGHLYNTDDGKTYSGNLIEIDQKQFELKAAWHSSAGAIIWRGSSNCPQESPGFATGRLRPSRRMRVAVRVIRCNPA